MAASRYEISLYVRSLVKYFSTLEDWNFVPTSGHVLSFM